MAEEELNIVIDVSGNRHNVYLGANLSGIDFTRANFTNVEFQYNNFVYDEEFNYQPSILTKVIWPDWVFNVENDRVQVMLTNNQMRDLNESNPILNEEELQEFINRYSITREYVQDQHIEYLEAIDRLQQRSQQGGKRKSKKIRKVKRRKSRKVRKSRRIRRYRK